MSSADWAVIAAGIAAIAWVNWYFFFAERGAVVVAPGAQATEVVIKVLGGYDPSEIRVRAGLPLRLVFDRQETSSCSEEVVIPDFNVKRFLPAFQKTTVEVPPMAPGSYDFTCGMSMLRGRIVAE